MIKKFFGKGDVFINVKSPTTVHGKRYETGETIAFFSNVSVALDYDLRHSESESRGRVLSYVSTQPYALTISDIENNQYLDRLMYDNYETKTVKYKEIKTIKFPNEVEYLNNSLIPATIKAYYNGGEVNIAFDEEHNAVNFEELYDRVDLVMEFEKTGKEYSFDKPNLGYLEIEATIKGRFGEQDGTFAVKLPTTDLVTEPMTVMTDTSNYLTSLSFALVNNEKPVMSYVEE